MNEIVINFNKSQLITEIATRCFVS